MTEDLQDDKKTYLKAAASTLHQVCVLMGSEQNKSDHWPDSLRESVMSLLTLFYMPG
jgi:hypothetical protein